MSKETMTYLTDEQFAVIRSEQQLAAAQQATFQRKALEAMLEIVANAPSPEKSREERRDYFAGQALAGMLAHSTRYKPRKIDSDLHWHEAISKEAYEVADAMLAERERGQ